MTKKPFWTPERKGELARLLAEGHTRRRIAATMGVNFYAVKRQIDNPGAYLKGSLEHHVVPVRIPEQVLAERDIRITAPYRDQTAMLCGDPPVGFSALDRREPPKRTSAIQDA